MKVVLPVVLLILALGQTPAPGQQQPTFKSGARTVAVYATVTDRDGRLAPDLTREVFEIRDNGKPQPITVFSNELQPITVVIMLDRSTSMRGNLRLVERAAEEFVGRLRPDDKARISTFANRIVVQPESFTGDRDVLLDILRSDLPSSGPTPLWNAMDEAIVALQGQAGRKVVLVFSDGGDSPMNTRTDNRSLGDVMRRAQQDDVMVYAIGLQTTVLRGRGGGGGGGGAGGGVGAMTGGMTMVRPDPGLSMIADDTGGGYFELTRADDLGSTFAQVAEELHHQYALGFEPPRLDDKTHKLDVRVTTKGMKVRARKEYVAGRAPETNGRP